MDQIMSQVDQLAELSDEQVMGLQEAIIGEFESYEAQDTTPETVDAMTSLADMLDTVRGEVQRREVAAEELAMRASEATMRVKGEESDMTGDEEAPAEEVVPTEEPTAPAEGESDTMEKETPTPEEEKEEEDKKMEFSNEEKAVVAESETPEIVAEEASAISEEVTEFSTDETVSEEASVEEASVETPEVTEDVTPETEVSEFSSEPEETTIEETPIALEEQEEQAPVTASVEKPFEAPADRQPVVQVIETAPVAITAGADIPGYTAGSNIANMSEVASAMEKRLHTLRRVNGGDGEQHIVASFTTQYPEYRTLSTDPESNASKIAAVVGPEALVASGGHSTPFEVKYDIFGFGVTDRPVRDALPKFQADRGGIRFITPPVLSSYADAVGVWTNAVDIDPTAANPDSVKASLTVSAAAEETVSTDAVTLQLQFGNLMTRAYPELIARHNELGLIQHAREAEQYLIGKISAGSTAVNAHVATTEAANLIGFARDFLVQIRKAAVAYRSRHRLSTTTVLKAIVPAWIFDAMSADLALTMPGDNTLGVGESEVRGYLASSNVDLVPSLDLNVFGAQSGSAAKLLEFPDTINWYLFAEGTFLFLDGGTLDLGIIRDSSLVGTNDYKMFIETFESVAKVGVESLAITSNISINGVAAALRDTTGGATAAAIEE